MIMSALRISLLASAMALGAVANATDPSGLKAWLEPIPRGDVVEFQGYVSAPEPMLVTYRLVIERISQGGRAKTSQGGRVKITTPNEPTRLSLTAINVRQYDSYEAELTVTGPLGQTVQAELSRRPVNKIKI